MRVIMQVLLSWRTLIIALSFCTAMQIVIVQTKYNLVCGTEGGTTVYGCIIYMYVYMCMILYN